MSLLARTIAYILCVCFSVCVSVFVFDSIVIDRITSGRLERAAVTVKHSHTITYSILHQSDGKSANEMHKIVATINEHYAKDPESQDW